MKIIKEKRIEGCLEGSNVKDFLFDRKITLDFVLRLGKLGKLIYNEEIEKPFFRVIVKGKYTLKGSVGNSAIRALLPEKGYDELMIELQEFVSQYEGNEGQ